MRADAQKGKVAGKRGQAKAWVEGRLKKAAKGRLDVGLGTVKRARGKDRMRGEKSY